MADSDLFVGLMRELLERGCHVRFRAAGTSMHPAIRDGEVVTVARSSGDAFAVGDVLLCRFGRRPAAHRVVAVELSEHARPVLHLHGDNLCSPDVPVRAEDVIGRVLTVNRDGSEHTLDGPGRLLRLRRMARWLFAAAVVLTTVMGASDALAQVGGRTLTWVGGNGRDWSTRQNWLPEEIPSRGADLLFPAAPFFLTAHNDLNNLSLNSITIQGNGYIISGLALESGGVQLQQAVRATVALNLTLNRDPIHVATNGGTLELSGRITARNFVKQGAGTLVLSGANDDITDLIGEDGCGVIRATNPSALGVSLVGRGLIGQDCALQVEAGTTVDKPTIVNGVEAPGTTGALVITAGVRLIERLELRVDSPAKISVLSGAALDLPDSQVGLTMNLNSALTVHVDAAGAVRMSGTVAGGTREFSLGPIIATAKGGTISVGRGGQDTMTSREVTMGASTTLEIEFNGNRHDTLFVDGSVALNGAALSVIGQFPPNMPVAILDNDSNDAVVGTFAGLPQGGTVPVGGVRATISYA